MHTRRLLAVLPEAAFHYEGHLASALEVRTMVMSTEKRSMPGIAVALLTEDREQSVILHSRVESTNLARTVLSHTGFPAGPSDAVLRQLQDQRAEVALVSIDPKNPQHAIRAIRK